MAKKRAARIKPAGRTGMATTRAAQINPAGRTGIATTKAARINPAGKIVPSDREIHVKQDNGNGVADQVEFRYVGKATMACTIDFSPYLQGSPFEGDVETFDVPIGGRVVQQISRDKEPGRYKYDVYETAHPDNLTDDPDVIVD